MSERDQVQAQEPRRCKVAGHFAFEDGGWFHMFAQLGGVLFAVLEDDRGDVHAVPLAQHRIRFEQPPQGKLPGPLADALQEALARRELEAGNERRAQRGLPPLDAAGRPVAQLTEGGGENDGPQE